MSISTSIDLSKVEKQHLVIGKTGKQYLSLRLVPFKNGVGQYGDHGFVVQDVSKEARAQGIRGPIVGNYKDWDRVDGAQQIEQARNQIQNSVLDDDSDSIPF